MSIPKLEITKADGSTIVVVPNLFDTFGFEKLLKSNPRMGGLQENSMKLQAFRAWSAAKRQGLTEQTWEQFSGAESDVLQVTPYKEPEPEDDDELEVAGLGLDTQPEA